MNGSTEWHRRRGVVFAAWLALGLVVGFHPMLRHGASGVLAGYPDTRLIALVLESSWRCALAAGEGCSPWRPPFFHPVAESGALTELQLGTMPFYALGRVLGGDPLAALLLSQLLQSVAVFALAFWLLRRGLSAKGWEAGLGALLVAFGSPKMAQIYHSPLFGQAAIFLAAVLLQRALTAPAGERESPLVPFGVAALLALQLYSGVYVTVLAAMLVAAATPFLLAWSEERGRLAAVFVRRPVAWGAAALLAVLAVWPLVAHQRAAAKIVALPGAGAVAELLPPPIALVNTGDRSLLGAPLARRMDAPSLSHSWEHALGVGVVTTLLILAGTPAALRTRWLRGLALGSLLAWLVVLRWPGGFSVWRLLVEAIPDLAALRAVGRLQLVVLPVLAAMLLLGLRGARRRFGPVVAALLAVLVVAEQIRDWGARGTIPSVTPGEIAAALPGDCASFFVSTVGGVSPDRHLHLSAMWAALETGVPTINGYSGYRPAAWRLGAANEPEPGAGDLRDRLAAWSVASGIEEEICWLRADLRGTRPAFGLERVPPRRVPERPAL